MRDIMPESYIHPLSFYGPGEYDNDYDVHYFSTSVAPYIISPEDFEILDHLQVSFVKRMNRYNNDFGHLKGPCMNRWALGDELPRRPISPVGILHPNTPVVTDHDDGFFQALSCSYTIDTEFMFPDIRHEPSLGGYSRVFRAGLAATVCGETNYPSK